MGAEGGGCYALTTRVSLTQYIQKCASKKEKEEEKRGKFLDECFSILLELVKDGLVFSLFPSLLAYSLPPLLFSFQDTQSKPSPKQQAPQLSHQQPSQKTHLLCFLATCVHFLSSHIFDCLQPPISDIVPSLLKICRDVVVTQSTNLALSKSVVKVCSQIFGNFFSHKKRVLHSELFFIFFFVRSFVG